MPNCHHRIALLFAGAILFGGVAPVRTAAQPGSDDGRVRIVVPSDEGIVTGQAILSAIAEASNLESDDVPARSFGDGIDLTEPTARLTLLLIGAAIPDVTLQIDEEDGRSPALIVTIDVEKIEARARSKKRTIRRALKKAAGAVDGLSDVTFPDVADPDVIVVLIHGFESSPHSMKDLESFLLEHRRPVAQFQYPGDERLTESVALLAAELDGLKKKYPDRDIVLVAHSMGGIIARGVVELPAYAGHNVSRLIMIAPPNHGSQWARLPSDFDGRDTLDRKTRNALRITQLIADSLNGARADLHPQSPFLQKLNQCPRAAGVDYSIIAGTGGPLTDDQRESLRTHLENELSDSDTSTLRPLARGFAENLDEIVAGRGDGVVSVDSAKLEGVDDFVTLPMRHSQIDGNSRVTRQLFEEIDRRINPKSAE